MDYKKYICGAKPSPKDERDYPIQKLITKSPRLPEYYRTDVQQKILDQGEIGCCVAESLSMSRFIQEKQQHGTSDYFSPMYIYGNRELDDLRDEGMYPREALKTLKKYGVCKEEYFDGLYTFPIAEKKYNDNKTFLDQKAYPYRISSYYRLMSKFEIMTAVYELGVVTICCPVYESLYFPDENGYVPYIDEQEFYGYHEMTLVGYDINKRVWIVQNSWGSEYGDNGFIYMDMEYPISEAWAMTDGILEREIKEKYGEQD